MIEITSNLPAFGKALDEHLKAAGFAETVALTRTARTTAGFLSELAGRVFDRPTRWTLNAFGWAWATPERKGLFVFVKDRASAKGTAAAKYLKAEITGGSRAQKRSEKALHLPGFWVPGPGVKLDAYGNVPGSVIRRILSDLRADGETGYLANRTARSTRRNRRYRAERYFIPAEGSKLHPGVWVRRGRAILPVLLFVPAVRYGRRLDFFGRGMTFAEQRFPQEMAQALREKWNLPRSDRALLGFGGIRI